MCNCKQDIETRLTARVAEQKPQVQNIRVALGGYTFPISDTLGLMPARPTLPIEVRFQAPKKAGGLKDVKESISMAANFCPFCGESLRAEGKATGTES